MGHVVGPRPAAILCAVAASCLLESAGTVSEQGQGAFTDAQAPPVEVPLPTTEAGGKEPPPTREEGASGEVSRPKELSRPWRAPGLALWPATGPDPYAPGPLAVQQFVASLNFGPDWRRREPFEVVAFLPDSEGVGKFFEPFPIVVWGGGLALGQGNYEPAARLAASHGVAMIVAIFFDDLLDLLSDEEGAWASERIIDWIDEQASGPWAGRVAADSLGVGGHSGGGKVAMWTAIRDPRVLAAFVIDPVDRSDFSPDDFEAYPSVTPELMDLFGIPGGFVGGGLSSRRSAFGPCVPPDENYHEFFRCAGSPAFEYFLPEAGHLDFAYGAGIRGLACPAGRRPARSRSLAYGTMVAFFRLFLANDDRYRPWVDGDALLAQPDVVFASH